MLVTPEMRRARLYLRALLASFTFAVAVLLIALSLYRDAHLENVVPAFDLQLPLLHGTTLEIGMVAGCPVAMSAMACLHIQDQFPQAFRVTYWSDSQASRLVSIAMPQR